MNSDATTKDVTTKDVKPSPEPAAEFAGAKKKVAESRRFIKNSAANVVTGASSAVAALVVPPFLIRILGPDEFGVWMLILQIGAYTSLLNLGLQGAVGRYVAYHSERGEEDELQTLVSTAMSILLLSGVVAAAAFCIAAPFMAQLFPQMPAAMAGRSGKVLIIVGLTLAAGLPASVFNGIFVGYQRNEIPAIITGSSRVIQSVLLIVSAYWTRSLLVMASAYAVVNLLSYAVQWRVQRRLFPTASPGRNCTRDAFQRLWQYCGSVMVWSLCMLAVNGVDLSLVGRFDFNHVAVYAACLGPIVFMNGIQQALFSPVLQIAAKLHARGEEAALSSLLVKTTRYAVIIVLLTGIPIVFLAKPILHLWLGNNFSQDGAILLSMLVIGNGIRIVAVPFANILMATLQHRGVIIGPILEAVANLMIAIWAGSRYGAVGVAAGMIAGAIIGQIYNIIYYNKKYD